MVVDQDIITACNAQTQGGTYILGAAIHYLIKHLEKFIERRKTDLLDKKPGALMNDLPKIVWVRMLKRPKNLSTTLSAIQMWGKFNSLLEEHLALASNKHHLISIEVDETDFNCYGELTSTGMCTFWDELDRGMKKFDFGEITLKPRIKNDSVKTPIVLPK